MDSRLIFLHFILKVMGGQRKLGVAYICIRFKYVGSQYEKICVDDDLRYDEWTKAHKASIRPMLCSQEKSLSVLT